MQESHAAIRLLRGEEILAWVRRPEVKTYRYQINVGGFWLLAVLALVMIGFAGYQAWFTRLSSQLHIAAFSVLLGSGLFFTQRLFHWILYVARRYVGVSSEELLVGRGAKAYVIPTSRLTREGVGFGRMGGSRLTAALPLRVDHLDLNLHLVGPIVVMKNVQLFMADILEIILRHESPELAEEQGRHAGTVGEAGESRAGGDAVDDSDGDRDGE